MIFGKIFGLNISEHACFLSLSQEQVLILLEEIIAISVLHNFSWVHCSREIVSSPLALRLKMSARNPSSSLQTGTLRTSPGQALFMLNYAVSVEGISRLFFKT